MATLTIRDVNVAVKAQLRVRAARHGRSMEAELRCILIAATALAACASVATRDTGGFSGCGVTLIDP